MISAYDLFFNPGEVVEIRAIGLSGKNPGWTGFARETVLGYFNNAQDFEKCAAILDKAGATGVYYTLNPCNPALLARAANRLKVMKYTTQDKDIVCVRWLPIDLDPKRPAGISATDAEVALAKNMAKLVTAWMETEMGFSKAVRGFSGNGYHLLYRLPDLPNNAETHDMIVKSVAAIAAKFDNDTVDIDVSVVNPARIWKLYGTTGRKGDSTTDRPHRKSYIMGVSGDP
ncbi:MAG TPA: hypothetical protein DCG53_11895 [Syntrophus sp. (in: bacteria)]|jgi:hypothetical protein|nr:hypothetical protein [Syntrophus sp. (in: bacteria)]